MKRSIVNAPIIVTIFYLFMTLIIFMYNYCGKLEYAYFTSIYVALNYLCLLLGYISAKCSKSNEYNHSINVNNLLVIFSFAFIVISICNIVVYYPKFSDLLYYMTKPGESYEHIKFLEKTGGTSSLFNGVINSIVGVAVNILGVLKFYIMGLLIFYWKKVNIFSKFIALLSILVYLCYCLLFGTVINVGILLFSSFPFLILLFFKKNTKEKVRSLLIVSVFFVLMILFLGSREAYSSSQKNGIISGIIGLGDYVSLGYEGLSYSLQLKYVPVYGQGIFHGLATTINKYLGISDLFNDTYMYRAQLQFGWPALQKWSTAFAWIASDTGFVLIPVLMFIIGNFWKKLWVHSISTNNVYGLLLVGQIIIFVAMIPANIQIFHTFGNTMSFFIICLTYLRSKKK